jgi:hypothetical protein
MKPLLKRVLVVIVILIAGLVVAAYYLGILDWQSTETELRLAADRARAGVQSELSISPATSGNPVENAKVCRENLRRIESAKRVAAEKHNITVGAVSWDYVLDELGGQKPVCPSGGSYTLGSREVLCRCSVGSNHTQDKEDDHILTNF